MIRKKIIILLFLISINVHAEGGISPGVLGAGLSSVEESIDGYFYGRLLSLYYQMDIGFGAAFSPLMFYIKINDAGDTSLTFVNFSLYYDILNKNEELVLGPVVSIYAVDYKQPDFFEMRFGLQFTWRLPDMSIFSEMLALELGYKYSIQQQGFYAHVGVNLLVVLFYMGYIHGSY